MDLPAEKFPVAQEVVGGVLFHKKKVIFTRILMPVIVSRWFFDQCRQPSVGVHIQEMEGRDAQEKGK